MDAAIYVIIFAMFLYTCRCVVMCCVVGPFNDVTSGVCESGDVCFSLRGACV